MRIRLSSHNSLLRLIAHGIGVVAIGTFCIQNGLCADANDQEWAITRTELQRQIQPGMAIIVDNPYGDVQVKRAPSPLVPVYSMVQKHVRDQDDPQIEANVTDKMIVTVSYPPGSMNDDQVAIKTNTKRRVDLTLFVPMGSPLFVKTRNGKIIVKGLKSDVTAQSGKGNIFVRTTGTVNAASDHGDISVYFKKGSWSRSPKIETKSGDISIRMPPEADSVVWITTTGEITTDFSVDIKFKPKSDSKRAFTRLGNGKHHLEVKSLNGNVKLLKSREEIYQ